jgi:hypothetical protein
MAGRLVWRTDRSVARRIADSLIASLQALPAIALAISVNRGGEPSALDIPPLLTKLENMLRFAFFDTSIPVLLLFFLTGAMLAGLALRLGWTMVAPTMIGPIATLFCAYLALPIATEHGPSSAWGIDWRLLPLLAWIAFSSLREAPEGLPRSIGIGMATVSVSVLLTATLTMHWLPWVRHEAALRACLTEVPRGARVMSLILPPTSEAIRERFSPPGVMHLAAWAVTDRSAFVPTLFAHRFQQPLSYSPEYEALQKSASSLFYNPGDSESVLADFDFLLALLPVHDRTIPTGIAEMTTPVPCEGRYFALLAVN